MKERDEHSLGAEGYIPQELLTRVKSKDCHLAITFCLDDSKEAMARRFATSFYKELRREGLSEAEIADFSTELLKILLGKLEAYKEKISRR